MFLLFEKQVFAYKNLYKMYILQGFQLIKILYQQINMYLTDSFAGTFSDYSTVNHQ